MEESNSRLNGAKHLTRLQLLRAQPVYLLTKLLLIAQQAMTVLTC